MSLINKMLQDLEQRQGASPHLEAMAGQMRSAPKVRNWRGAALAAVCLLALVGGAAAWVLMQPRPALPVMAGAPVVVAVAPAVAPAKAVAAKPAAPDKPSSALTPRGEEVKKGEVKSVATVVAAVKNPPRAVMEETAAPVERPQGRAATQGSTQKSVNPQQASDNLYKQALVLVQQGRGGEAQDTLRKSLDANPRNVESLQLLVDLLVEGRNIDAALPLLREGLKLMPEQSGLSMNLARLQMDRADTAGAMATLEQGLPSVRDDAQYHAFYAALLQRAGRHDEAVVQYLSALRSDPAMPNWLVGIGISLHVTGKDADAAEAFQRAKDGGRLASPLAEFVDQRLGQLRR